jgi:hypothetical protein
METQTGGTKMTVQRRTEELAATLSQVVGAKVEITVRGDRAFTFSTERVDQDLEFHLVGYFGSMMELDAETQIDGECGTFVYMRAV